MRAEIISCGTELLLGHITDTNATYLAQSLAALGIDLYFVSQVGDNQGRIVETLRRAWERSDLVIITGGLGPTEDDLARESISVMLGETMQVDAVLEAELRAMFAGRNITMPERNIKQATLIPSAQAGTRITFGPGCLLFTLCSAAKGKDLVIENTQVRQSFSSLR